MGGLVSCPAPYTFDVAKSAEQYSTLASTLAGLAFVALIFILTDLRERMRTSYSAAEERSSAQNHIAISLLCSMLGLIVTAILYAVLAAEQGEALTQGRATSEAILSGIALAFSVMSLLYSLILLIGVSGLSATATEARLIVATLTPALATMFIGFAAQDAALVEVLASRVEINGEARCSSSGFYDDVRLYGAFILPLVVLCTSVLLSLLSRSRWRNSDNRRIPKGKRFFTRNALPKASLIVTLVAAVWSATWSGRGPSAQLSHLQIGAWLLGAAIVMLAQAVFILWGTGGESLEDEGRPKEEAAESHENTQPLGHSSSGLAPPGVLPADARSSGRQTAEREQLDIACDSRKSRLIVVAGMLGLCAATGVSALRSARTRIGRCESRAIKRPFTKQLAHYISTTKTRGSSQGREEGA